MIEAVVFCRRSTPSHAYCTHTSSICLRHGHLLVQACTHPPMFRVSARPPTGPGMHPPTHVPCFCTATHWSRPAPTHPCFMCLHGHLLVQACTHPHVFRVSARPRCVCRATYWSRPASTHTCSMCPHGHPLVQACTHPHIFRVPARPPTGPGVRQPTHVPCVCMATYRPRSAPVSYTHLRAHET